MSLLSLKFSEPLILIASIYQRGGLASKKVCLIAKNAATIRETFLAHHLKGVERKGDKHKIHSECDCLHFCTFCRWNLSKHKRSHLPFLLIAVKLMLVRALFVFYSSRAIWRARHTIKRRYHFAVVILMFHALFRPQRFERKNATAVQLLHTRVSRLKRNRSEAVVLIKIKTPQLDCTCVFWCHTVSLRHVSLFIKREISSVFPVRLTANFMQITAINTVVFCVSF